MSRKRIIAVVAGILVTVLVAVGVLWAFPVLTVRTYEVTGAGYTSQEDIVAATGVPEGANLVRVDASSAAAGVVSLPWVRTATVDRGWPDTLEVTVTERQAVLYSVEDDGDHLIDETGKPFLIDVPPETAVEVTGDQRQEPAVLTSVATVVASLPEEIRGQVARVDIPSEYDITFHLHDGRTVYWGANENNHDKALAMQTVLTREGQHWNISNPAMVTVR